jgi:hypothetical protein
MSDRREDRLGELCPKLCPRVAPPPHRVLCHLPARSARVRSTIVPAMQLAFFWEFGDHYLYSYDRHRDDTMFAVKA